MKKTILILFLGISFQANSAQPFKPLICSYSPLQQVIMSARNEAKIVDLLKKNVDFNVKQKCGGSILQLAILRGNPLVLKVLLENGVSTEEKVSLTSFPILGAPMEVPLILFAAYYSPRSEMMDLLMQAGASVLEKDTNGENILWYMRQNPVLRDTNLYDEIQNTLLLNQEKIQTEGKVEKEDSKKAKAVEIQEPDLPEVKRNYIKESAF